MSTWFRVHDSIVEHPKFVGLNADAWTLWIHGASYASRNLTDGAIPRAIVGRLAPIKSATKTAGALVAAGVWDETPEGWQIHDWADHQRTAEEVADQRKTRAERGSLGNHNRWHKAKNKHDPNCQHCVAESSLTDRSLRQLSDTERIAEGQSTDIANRSLTDRKAIAESESESESESELLKSRRQLTVVSDPSDDDDDRIKLVASIVGTSDYERAKADGVAINHAERYRSAAIGNRLTEATEAVRQWPTETAEAIAEWIIGGTKPVTSGGSQAVRDTRRGPDACELCHDTGWTINTNGDAKPCNCPKGAA